MLIPIVITLSMISTIVIKIAFLLAGHSDPKYDGLYEIAIGIDAIECIWIFAYLWYIFYYSGQDDFRPSILEPTSSGRYLICLWAIYGCQAILIFPLIFYRMGIIPFSSSTLSGSGY